MALFWRREERIINKIEAYLDQVDKTRDLFRRTMEELVRGERDEHSEARVMEVHASESLADDIRREIELEMYRKALIPESRGDVLGLIESMDMVPNLFQSLCDQLLFQKIDVPPEFQERYLKLVEVNIDSYNLLREAILALFYRRDCQEQLRRIDGTESESDGIERGLVKDIFATDMDKADKILLKEIVVNTGDISDTVEIAADRLNLAIIKRRI
jgi:predicted phosphate transport protein (TIGR00153 family)